MKSEERHKLQQNELADYLAKTVEKIKPYQNAILGGIILVLVLILLLQWWNGRVAAENEEASAAFYVALEKSANTGDATDLDDLVIKYPGTPIAGIAALTAADITLKNGCDLLFTKKTKGLKEIKQAAEAYKALLQTLRHPFLIAQAQYGLARAKECLNELSEAKELYKSIAKEQPNGPFGFLAANRLADLDRPETQEMLGKFASWTPPVFSAETSDLKLPKDMGFPSEPSLIEHDSFGKTLKQGGSMDTIKTENFLKDGVLPSTDVLPPPDTNKEEPKPTDTAPAPAKPADTAPATPEPAKPAENQPVAPPVENK
jgi:predicted negative regulator of RcsB-dependent stress response